MDTRIIGLGVPAESVATPAIAAAGLVRSFKDNRALDDVSIRVMPGEIHALLGPNGAGKTTLLKILSGLAAPDEGDIQVLGQAGHRLMTRDARAVVGLIPSGDRSFYLRLSGLENLMFFARLYGMPKRQAASRSWDVLRAVDLEAAAKRQVGVYSHGMQKRLSVARALLMDPPIMLVDEATHDLDPEASRTVRSLVVTARDHGAAVVWATQRLDEIRGFADRVTLLHEGRVRFEGTVPELMAVTVPRRYLVHVRGRAPLHVAARALTGIASLTGSEETEEQFLLVLEDGAGLGEAIVALVGAGLELVACREERSEIESAFLFLVRGTS